MAESGTMNPDNKVEQIEKKEDEEAIKTEEEVLVKREAVECVVCTSRSRDAFDIYVHNTAVSGATLHHFLNKYATVDIASVQNSSRALCKSCYDLINVLEQAELEYLKLKETFESIISKNPLFEPSAQPIKLPTVKAEAYPDDDNDDDYVCDNVNEDSDDDMPLSTQSKRKRIKVVKKKKKESLKTPKRKLRSKINSDSWECDVCGKKDSVGGADALVAHKLANHTIDNTANIMSVVKTEDSAEGSQSPLFNNGFGSCLKIEVENFDDDSLTADDDMIEPKAKKKGPVGRPRKGLCLPKQGKTKKSKEIHQCDQCDAKYTSLARLEQHKQKHDGSKPPYICEVCGAHYKHKRACDIHIALHKGISDWKCEECNKLFPSKNALQRHNNIHTGKLNYQCDLCGKSFIHTSSFKMHKLSHSGVKPHACDVCGLALMTRSHLKRHKRVHSGEKRHECPICGKRFSERYNLAAHSKSHEASEPVLPQPRRRLFRCIFCPERFERRYMLERHMQVVHGRALERPPPTPRNTMSKLLKAQAQRRDTTPSTHNDADTKDELSSDSTARPIAASKLIAQLSSSSLLAPGTWASSYAHDFGARPDFPH